MSTANLSTRELLDRAHAIRRGERAEPEEAFAVAKELARRRSIEEARLLAQHLAARRAMPPARVGALVQKWALWTSQNPDAPDDGKHDEALALLEREMPEGARLSQTADPETLGIAGGICKRQWGADGQRRTLERALAYYERGVAAGVAADSGYTAINAAFVLDLLAADEGEGGQARRERAAALRARVRDELSALADLPASAGGRPRRDEPFFWETLAEAHFGLRDYDAATRHLQQAYRVREPEPWERETTARQFAWLARLHEPAVRTSADFERSPAWGVLRTVYGGSAAAGAGSLFAGKLGLSLSGGGFRASLFHIGVLAALAERDLLRHVEVLSCVSGGSILGAHYYLEVRRLLQDKADADITRDDWIALVERVAEQFLAGVQKNLRVRIGTGIVANLKMLFKPGYTMTTRLAELYEEHLFSRVPDDGERRLAQLRIRPKGQESLVPKYDNWQRANKVPILILNATALNTGHNWQFTTSWMGEPPSAIESRVDGNYRLRRMYLENEAPPAHRDIRIGAAAAASACVPGLFTPLELRDLYPGITVRLVDGGVHDNQGMFGLLDQNCSVMLVSDASGQMSTVDDPPDGPLGVLLRTVSLLQARVRVACFREIEARRKSGRLKGMLFLHLKRGLEVEARDWIDCGNPKLLSAEELLRVQAPLTDFGVVKRVQEKLAAMRTDLDSFSDLEGWALMASGCAMTRATVGSAITGFAADERPHPWRFLKLADAMRDEAKSRALEPPLAAAAIGMFRMFALAPPLQWLRGVLLGLLGLGLLAATWLWHGEPLGSVRGLVAGAAMAVLAGGAGWLGLGLLVKLVRYRKTLHQIVLGALLAGVGWLLLGLHLKTLDRWFLKQGSRSGEP